MKISITALGIRIECHYAEHCVFLFVLMFMRNIAMLSVVYAECRYVECRYDECRLC
jgi:hypothetical protein